MTKAHIGTAVAVVAALAVVALFFVFNNPLALQAEPTTSTMTAPNGQLVVQDEMVGTGALAQNGDTISVAYTGTLQSGTVFDSSVGREPYTFVLGTGAVIPGWDRGLQGMKVGGKRLLIIPPELAYGSKDYGPIPANSTLIFEIQLVKVERPGQAVPSPTQ